MSRWFTRDAPNWTLNSVSDLANALDLDIRIEATDRKTGTVFTPAGPAAAKRVHPPRTETASHRVERPSEAPTTKAD